MKNLMQKAKKIHHLAQGEIRKNPGDTVLIIVALYVIAAVSFMAAVL